VLYISRTSRRGIPFKTQEEYTSDEFSPPSRVLLCCSKNGFFWSIDQFILFADQIKRIAFINSSIDERDFPTPIHRGVLFVEIENTIFLRVLPHRDEAIIDVVKSRVEKNEDTRTKINMYRRDPQKGEKISLFLFDGAFTFYNKRTRKTFDT